MGNVQTNESPLARGERSANRLAGSVVRSENKPVELQGAVIITNVTRESGFHALRFTGEPSHLRAVPFKMTMGGWAGSFFQPPHPPTFDF